MVAEGAEHLCRPLGRRAECNEFDKACMMYEAPYHRDGYSVIRWSARYGFLRPSFSIVSAGMQ